MQTPKSLLVVSVVALGTALLPAQTNPSDPVENAREVLRRRIAELNAQPGNSGSNSSDPVEKAREVLRMKMNELNSQPGKPSPSTPVPSPAADDSKLPHPVQVLIVPSATTPAAPIYNNATPAPVYNATPEEQARAAELLKQKMAELNARQNNLPLDLGDKDLNKAAVLLRQKMAELDAKPNVTPVITVDTSDKDLKAKEIAEARAKMKAEAQAKAVMAKPAPVSQPEVKPVVAKSASKPEPTSAPALAPGSKEQRLADLLKLYKSDKITPEEYHNKRAQIISEP